MKIDRDTVRLMRKEIAQALAAIETKYDVSFDLGNVVFSETEFRGKLTCTIGSAREVENRKKEDLRKNLERYGAVYGITADCIGKNYLIRDTLYTLVGLTMKRKCHVIINRVSDGKQYKMDIEAFKAYAKINSGLLQRR